MSLSRPMHAYTLRACQMEPYDGSFFSFSLTGKTKCWYNLTIESRQGDWEALCSSFCLQFFPISRVVKLCLEVLSFRQKKKESLGMAWECFITLIKTGPNLDIQDPILLQHFYMGLNRKTRSILIRPQEAHSCMSPPI